MLASAPGSCDFFEPYGCKRRLELWLQPGKEGIPGKGAAGDGLTLIFQVFGFFLV